MTRPHLPKAEHAARKARETELLRVFWEHLNAVAEAKRGAIPPEKFDAEGRVDGCIATSLEELVLIHGSFMGVFERRTDYIAPGIVETLPTGPARQCFSNAFDAMVDMQGNNEVAAVRYCEGLAFQEGLPIPIHHAWVQMKCYGEKSWRVYDPTWPIIPRSEPRMVVYRGMAFHRADVQAKRDRHALWSGMLLDDSLGGEFLYLPVMRGHIKFRNTVTDHVAKLPSPVPG